MTRFDQMTSALTGARLADPADADDLIRTFATSIKVLTGQDQLILDDITTATGELERVKEAIQTEAPTDPLRLLRDALPTFILHSTTSDHIPNESMLQISFLGDHFKTGQ
jgi:hypothetical protein